AAPQPLSLPAALPTLPEGERAASRSLHVPTDEVYGSLAPTDPAFTETRGFEPNSPYSASKAASDPLVRAWHHTYGLPVLTTNCKSEEHTSELQSRENI